MGNVSNLQCNFLGGEVGKFAQGRYDRQDYRTQLTTCLNGFPVEIGAWVRRPGSMHAGHTRAGVAGRVIKFDFNQTTPYTIEFTDGFIRFRSGATIITTNDSVAITAISSANPAVVQTSSAVTWVTGNVAMFSALGTNNPLLQGRQFTLTKVDTTHFSIADAVTGTNIDGATIGSFVSGTIGKIQELVTLYTGSQWSTVRAVQAETTDILLHASVAPQALTVSTLPTTSRNAIFAIAPAIFNDGPYLDPFTNGAQVTPSAVAGVINLTISFPAYVATTAYPVGAFVTYSSVNYISIVDQNVGNQPDTHASQWTATSAAAAINNGQGITASDFGRSVRLFSEPSLWAVGTTYAATNIVAYNPSGLPGQVTYWTSLVGSNVGKIPGNDTVNWILTPQAAAQWSWGKITALLNEIDRALAGSASIGDMTSGGGLAAAFDGNTDQTHTAGCYTTLSIPSNTSGTFKAYVGKNWSGAADKTIGQATVFASNDYGFINFTNIFSSGTVTINLRGKASAPANSADGTLLGTSGSISNTTSPVTITSTDQTTAWKYAWFEVVVAYSNGDHFVSTTLTVASAEVKFFSPLGTGSTNGMQLEVLGPPLLYTTAIRTWRLGVYSNTTGWPTCGCYHEGRLWLGGAVANRFDASVSNGIVGGTVDFAPTAQYGAVAASNAITYTLNSDGVNPILWMTPDLQGVIMGTQAGEWLAIAPTSGPMGPANIAARRVTVVGCANVEPRRTDHTTVFVQRYGQKLMEMFAEVQSGKLSAPNLAGKAQHITAAGIRELAYTSAVTPIIWGRDGNGALFGVTYKRDALGTDKEPTFCAWHRHTLGSARTVESICAGPSTGGTLDSLTMVTAGTSSDIRHVELLTDVAGEGATLSSARYLDDAITPSSVVSSNTPITGGPYGALTIYGLWAHNGKTVQAWIGGLDCGDYAVAAGNIVVPFGDGVSAGTANGQFTASFAAGLALTDMAVGFTYTSDGQIVRPNAPAESGARNGPAFAKKRRNHNYGIQVEGAVAQTVYIGTAFTTARLHPALFKADNGIGLTVTQQFTGIHWDTIADESSYDGMLCWRVTRPYPLNLMAIGGFLSAEDT